MLEAAEIRGALMSRQLTVCNKRITGFIDNEPSKFLRGAL